MNEEAMLKRISDLEKRVTELEKMISFISDVKNSENINEYISSKNRALNASNLINSLAGSNAIRVNEQQEAISRLEKEKSDLDRRIKEAISQASNNNGVSGNQLENMFTYHKIADGIEIDSFDCFDNINALYVPDKIDGVPVVSIGENAFKNCKFNSVVLPETLKKICGSAFWCCNDLREINLPNGIKEIGTYAFYSTSISSVVIPGSLRKIPNNCFKSCNNLSNVVINEGVTEIENEAFSETKVKKIILPKSLKKLNVSLFGKSKFFGRNAEKIQIAFLNGDIELCEGMFNSDNILFAPNNCIYYCVQGSAVQKLARTANIECKPLTEFNN